VAEENRRCSNAIAPPDFYHQYCLVPDISQCAGFTIKKVEQDETGQFDVTNIPTTSACAWQLYHRTNGFLRFGGQNIEVRFPSLKNMDVLMGVGADLASLETTLTTADV
jgi:hypothetical protein